MADQAQSPADTGVQDTRTRKTVRLHIVQPAAAPEPPKTETIHDPLTARDTDTGNLEILSDTQTRRTLKLKPIAPGANPAVQLNIMQGSSNAPRKTVLLTPINPAKTPVPAAAPAVAAPVPAPAAPRTIPKPPGMADKKAPTVVLTSSPVTQVLPAGNAVSGTDDTTAVPRPTQQIAAPQKEAAPKPAVAPARPTAAIRPTTVIPKPAAASVPKPAAAAKPAAEQTEVNDSTSAVPRPSAGPEEEEDQTVKLKRPLRLAPPPVPAAKEDDQKATIKLPPPKLPAMGLKPPTAAPAPAPAAPGPSVQTAELKKPPVPQAVPKAPAEPKSPIPTSAEPIKTAPRTEAPEPDAKAAVEGKKDSSAIEEPETIELVSGIKQEQEKELRKQSKGKKPAAMAPELNYVQQPSALYLILTAISLLFVIASSTLSAVQYLDFCHGKKFYDAVPGLPIVK